jgi:hypothetical protein
MLAYLLYLNCYSQILFYFLVRDEVHSRLPWWIYFVTNSAYIISAILLLTVNQRKDRIWNMWVFSQERWKFRLESSQWDMAKIICKEHWIPYLINSTEMSLPSEHKHIQRVPEGLETAGK